MKAPLALAIVAAAMLAPALAHAQVKRPIYVECPIAQNSGEVGLGLCSSLRDAIAKSPRYALLTSPGKDLHSVIILSSIPIVLGDLPLNGAAASSVVFGFAFGDGPVTYLGHQVLTTGRHKVDEQAVSLLVDLDTLLDAMRTATP